MSVLATMRKLILGETWELPVGLGVVVLACLVVRSADRALWTDAGGFLLLAGVAVVVVAVVSRGARPKR